MRKPPLLKVSEKFKKEKPLNAIHYFIKKTRSSRTAKFWLISYILILLLPIIFSFISYYYVESSLAKKIRQTNETHLKNSQAFLDSTIGNILTATIELSANKNISSLAMQNEPLSGEQRLNMMLSSNDVWRSYYVYTGYIKNKYIYFADSDNIYTGSTIMSDHSYWLRTYNDGNKLDETSWKTNVLAKATSGFVCLNSGDDTRIFYVFPTYKYATTQVVYTVVAELNFEKLINDAAGTTKGSFFMHSSDGTLISNAITPAEAEAVRSTAKKATRNSLYYRTKNKFVVMRTMSNVSNWNYGYVMKYGDYWATLSQARLLMWVLSVLCIIIGLVIIVYLVKRNNKPLEELINLLSPTGAPQNYDAYEYINSVITKVLGEKETYAQKLYNQNDILKENVLSNILYGKKNDKFTYEEQLSMVGIDMQNKMFAAIALYAGDLSQMFADENYKASENDRQKLAQFIMSNIIGEELNEKYCAATVSMGNFVAVIINFGDSETDKFKADMMQVFTHSSELICKEFNFGITAAVSASHVSLSCLNDAYNEAVLCMEYAIKSDCRVLFYDEIASDTRVKNPLSFEAEQDIVDCLDNGDYKKCKKVIENLIYNFQLNKSVSVETARSFACDLLTTFFKHVIPNDSGNSGRFLASVEMNGIMSSSATVSGIMLKTITIIDRYLDSYDTEKKTSGTGKAAFYRRIRDYIDEHYVEDTLSVNELSLVFKTNSSYLSSQFKKEFGIGLLDYITTVRINAAKKLLVTTDLSNADIGERVGYANQRTFLRAFSKAEGITPKEYRRLNNPAI